MYFKILNDGAAVLAMNSQTTTDAYSYEAFGNPMGQAGTTVNPFRYVGALGYYWFDFAHHGRDRTSGLRLLGARYYGPSPRRFWTQDPFGGVPELPAAYNRYLYEFNNPVGSADPSGYGLISCLRCLWCWGKILDASHECRRDHPDWCAPRETDVRMIDPQGRMGQCIQMLTRSNYVSYCSKMCLYCWGPITIPPRPRL
jgi:RHS repeat-associated protein